MRSVGDPGHIDGVLVRDLDPGAIAVWEGGIREAVVGKDARGRRCGERGYGRILRGGEAEVREDGEDEEDGGEEEVVVDGHGGSSGGFMFLTDLKGNAK